MTTTFLENILQHKRALIKEKSAYYSSLKKEILSISPRASFKEMISKKGQLNLIAEIKKASPSKGIIREDFNPIDVAQIYVENKAAAISVLTEEKYFLGSPDFIKKISTQFTIPLLTKDFIIDEGQIYEACFNGASAILLIVAILDDQKLKDLLQVAAQLKMDCLVEVHDELQLRRALDVGAEMIGINNRDLKTFVVDQKTCERLIPQIPKGKIIVAESGITTHQDILRLKDMGFHAVLIGEAFMKEKNIAQKIKDVMNG